MAKRDIECQSCRARVMGHAVHLGFADMDALYCSSCPNVLLLKDRAVALRAGLTAAACATDHPDFQLYARHLLEVFKKVELAFAPCDCGGHFRYMNPPRCPHCQGLLRGDCYQDKPILKLTDGYVFISAGSIDAAAKIRHDQS